MKAKLKVEQVDELPFPKYMITTKGTILFVVGESKVSNKCWEGMCVRNLIYPGLVGNYCNGWEKSQFTDFKGKITIEQ